jgi:transcriptional regulator with XRE-family HTH domain
MNQFGYRLGFVRIQRGYSAPKLAKEIGCNPQSVYQWEWGRNAPSVRKLKQICEALNVSADVMLGLRPLTADESMDLIKK